MTETDVSLRVAGLAGTKRKRRVRVSVVLLALLWNGGGVLKPILCVLCVLCGEFLSFDS